MLGHSFPKLDEVSVRLAWVEDGANERWRALIEAGLASNDVLESAGVSPVDFLGALVASERELPFFDQGGEVLNGAAVEVEGVRDGRQVRIHTLMNFVAAEGAMDPTSTAARIGVEALIDGRVTGTGVLTPEVCFEPTDFIDHFIQDPAVVLTQETSIAGEFPNPAVG